MDKPQPLAVVSGRFGLGPRAGSSVRESDPRSAVEAQLAQALPTMVGLPTAADQVATMQRRRRAAAEINREKVAQSRGEQMPDRRERRTPIPRTVQRDEELAAWLANVVDSPSPLQERLALHWGNHFTVSAVKGKVGVTVGPFQREVIRPHVLGRFHEMLVSAVTHPSMLFYLDNDVSVGPDSMVGKRKQSGLNENLAREVLELHTLGADGGYTQQDVTSFAAVLTGWLVDLNVNSPTCGQTIFDPHRHQPGPKKVLGKTYPEDGRDQLMAVLADLAAHPATAKHVTRRFARSFVTDELPPAMATALERRFLETRGDLGDLARTLVRRDEAWSLPLTKMRPPIEFMAVASRLIGKPPSPPSPDLALVAMGQPFLAPPSPKGWPEEDDGWVTSDGVKTRLDWSQNLANSHAEGVDIKALVNGPLRPMLSDETRSTALRGESREQALTLLLMSPDLQRR
ncbi:DUF1800 family protein [Acetobacteraceae bacterium H6797]|nr:DUF1800 family protein [Acetobacteraceae bacterium H6797]